jgi:hypothetical protein
MELTPRPLLRCTPIPIVPRAGAPQSPGTRSGSLLRQWHDARDRERSLIERYTALAAWADEHRRAHQIDPVLQCILRKMSMILWCLNPVSPSPQPSSPDEGKPLH